MDVNVAAAFTPAGVPIEARSLNTGVVNATVNTSVVTLTPVGPGNTSVEVTARNASGSANLSIAVTVAAAAPPAPGAVGTLAPGLPLTVGGTAVDVDCRGRLHPRGRPDRGPIPQHGGRDRDRERKRRHPRSGGVGKHLGRGHRAQREWIGHPLDCGGRGGGRSSGPGSGGNSWPRSPSPPAETAVDVDVAAAFTPAGVPIEVRSVNSGVATATVNGSVVTLTPVGDGSTSVEVTARNASGSATLSIEVTVAVAAPEAPRRVAVYSTIHLAVGGTARRLDDAARLHSGGSFRWRLAPWIRGS